VTLRAKLGLLFLGALQVTFFAAVATFWAVQALRQLTEDLTMIDAQNGRAERLVDGAGGGRLTAAPVMHSIAELSEHAQTLEEKERVDALVRAVTTAAPGDRTAISAASQRLKDYYHNEVSELRDEARSVTRVSLILVFVVGGLVLAGMMTYFAAIQVWLRAPIQALGRATGIIATGDLDHRIPVTTRDEFGTLGASINAMAASLGEKQRRLLAAERFAMIGEMSAYVAHNIRNPLASIRAVAQAEMLAKRADDPERESFTDIVTAVDRLESWIGDLLRFSSPVTLDRHPEDLNALVTRCTELVRAQLAQKSVALDLARAPDVGAVSLDRNKIEQVVSVVLANAIEASPEGSTLRVACLGNGARACVRVQDQGGGIPRERLGSLFTMFATSKKSGTGLGLALAQKIVMAHDGQITVDSREGEGTTVEIALPAPDRS
jgi:signal transduction histidine kinase